MTADLVAFLRERIADDEQVARSAQRSTGHGDKIEGYATWRASSDGSGVWGEHISLARDGYGFMDDELATHIARWDPARVLAEVDAKRRVIEQHHGSGVTCPRCSLGTEDGQVVFELDPCQTLRLLALPYAGHPDYRAEWEPHVEVPRVSWRL